MKLTHALPLMLASLLWQVLPLDVAAQVIPPGTVPGAAKVPGTPGSPDSPTISNGSTNPTYPPAVEWELRQNAEDRMRPYGTDLLGDRIDPHTGSISFEHSDVSLPGNSGLEVSLRRRRSQGLLYHETVDAEFADWEYVVPRIQAVSISGWTGNRCTNSFLSSFPTASTGKAPHFSSISALDYSNGVMLDTPAAGSQQVLEKGSAPQFPAAAKYVTTQNWYLTCGVTASDGGQGFYAFAPNGDIYKFNRHISMRAGNLGTINTGKQQGAVRWKDILAATEVTDVHGNWVRYDYDTSGRLTRIHANDGREIKLSYSGSTRLVTQVDANTGTETRSWNYAYRQTTLPYDDWEPQQSLRPNKVLASVTQPDGYSWSFALDGMTQQPTAADVVCAFADPISVTHPYGVTGTFVLQEKSHRHGLTVYMDYVPNCPQPPEGGGGVPAQQTQTRAQIKTMSVTSKTLSGPAIPTSTWTYEYEEDGGPVGSSASDRTNWTRVTEPGGTVMTYYHFWNAETFGGQQQRMEIRESLTAPPVESSLTTYALENQIGFSFIAAGPQPATTRAPSRTTHVTVTRDGDIFDMKNVYDSVFTSPTYSFGFPTRSEEWSTIAGGSANKRIVDTIYAHNRTKWILGLPASITRNGKLFDSYIFNPNGLVTEAKMFGILHGTYTYHTSGIQAGRLHTFNDVLNRRTTLTNYKRGMAQSITRPDNVLVSGVVDANGWVTSITNARGYTTNFEFNDVGWLTKADPVAPWADTIIAYSNISSGLVKTETRGTSRTTTTYDSRLRPIRTKGEDLTGLSSAVYTSAEFDVDGNQIFSSFPSFSANPTNGVENHYDALDRLVRTRENVAPFATTTMEYLSGARMRVTDPVGAVTTTSYRRFGMPDEGEVIRIDQPTGVITEMSYDIFGNMLTARQRGTSNGFAVDQTQSYFYDSRLRLCRHHVPETGSTIYGYDDANQMIWRDPGKAYATNCPTTYSASNATLYAYDSLGRVSTVNYPGSTPDVTMTYDANGNVRTTNRGGVNWTYTYTTNDMLHRETLSLDGRSYNVIHGYDTNGYPTSLTYPDGKKAVFAPDGFGRPTRVQDNFGPTQPRWANNITYHANGAVANTSYLNGQVLTQTQNARQLLTGIDVRKGASVAVNLDYNHDANARITAIDDLVNPAWNRSFTYDLLGRLTDATGVWGAARYTYDALGNMRRKQLGTRVVEIQYLANNRVQQFRDSSENNVWQTFAHDARGNVTDTGSSNFGGVRFTYDYADQPVTMIDAATGSFTYDGNLKRVKQVINGKTIYSVYSQSGTMLYRDNVTDNETTAYIPGSGGIRLKNGVPDYTHKDHLGSPIAMTDASGTVLWREMYSPFGLKQVDPAANRDNEGFTGHIDDDASGLTYMQARFYDPVLGRFLSNDPVGFAEGGPQMFGRYTYVYNDPVNLTDPNGECPWCIGAIIGLVAEGISIASDIAGGREVSVKEGAARLAVSTALGAVGGGFAGRAIKSVVGSGFKAIGKKAAYNASTAGLANGYNTAARAGIQVSFGGETDISAEDVAKDVGVGAAAAIGGQVLSEAAEFVGKFGGVLSKNADLAAGGTSTSRGVAVVVEGATNAIGVNTPAVVPDEKN